MVPPLAVPDILPNRVVTDAAFLQGDQVLTHVYISRSWKDGGLLLPKHSLDQCTMLAQYDTWGQDVWFTK